MLKWYHLKKGGLFMHGFWKRLTGIAVCAAMLCTTALAYSTLERGDSGSEVTRLQQALSALGYTVGADGVYGTQTINMVKAFQQDHGLKVDGKAGDVTQTLLYSLTAQQNQVLQPVVTAAPAAVQQSGMATAVVSCSNGGKLNLRSGAGSGYSVIEQIPTGTSVLVLDAGSKWSYVAVNGALGYVMTSFLNFGGTAPVQQPAAATAAPVIAGSTQAVVSCADGGKLNLRKTASSNASILARIPNGTVLTVQQAADKWFAVTYNGETGFVLGIFLDFNLNTAVTAVPVVAPTPTPVPQGLQTAAPAGQGNATVRCADNGKLNLRKSANANAKVLDRIPSGTVLTVQTVDDKWSYTTYNGQPGYVMNKYLQLTAGTVTAAPAAIVTAVPTQVPGVVTTVQTAAVTCKNGGKLNLREGAGANYKVILQIPNGSAVTVFSRGSEWCQISYGGLTGYVMSSFLTFTGTAATAMPGTVATYAPVVIYAPVITPVPQTAVSGLQYEEFRYATVSTNSGSLNIRKGPGTTYAKAGEVRDGTRIVISSIEGEWCAMYYGDIQGYVQRQYLVIAAPSGTADVASGTYYYDTSVLTRTLRGNETGADVSMVQQRLIELKYLSFASGVYDSATMTAVRAFQKQHGLTQDGKAGTSTLTQLFSSGATAYNPSAGAGSYTSYVIDYNGNTSSAKTSAVRRAQQALRDLNYNVPLTGAFEARTHDAIVAFQLRNGLTATGELDSATQTMLYSGAAHDVAWPSRYYLSAYAGRSISTPANVQLLHWYDQVSGILKGQKSVTVYDPATGLSWHENILSCGHHLDAEPAALEDTLIQKKSFGGTSWEIHPVYVLLPDGQWSLATMHDYPHGVNTVKSNGFGGQNCIHFLRDMSEAQRNDPSYGVQNQQKLREARKNLTGIVIAE